MRYYVTEQYLIGDAENNLTNFEANSCINSYYSKSMDVASDRRTWDPVQNGVMTKFNPYLQDIVSRLNIYDFSSMDEPIIPISELTSQEQHVMELAQGFSQDLVATFGMRLTMDMSSIVDFSQSDQFLFGRFQSDYF